MFKSKQNPDLKSTLGTEPTVTSWDICSLPGELPPSSSHSSTLEPQFLVASLSAPLLPPCILVLE